MSGKTKLDLTWNGKDERPRLESRTWCRLASEHGEKPWPYLLIPHDAIDESKTLAGLAAS
jgi:hypothetical protein